MASKLSSEKAIAGFTDLFRKARRELSRLGKKATEEASAWREAMSFASQHQIPGAEDLLRAALLCFQTKDAKALSTLDTAAGSLPEELKGHGEAIRAVILCGLKKYDESILAAEKALKSPGFDSPETALNSLGNAYCRKGDNDRAIDYYQQALTTPGFDASGMVLQNIGLAYSAKGDHDRAIAYYRQALATPGYDTPHKARVNLANTLRAAGQLESAANEIETVLSEPDTEGQHQRAKYIQGLIRQDTAGLAPSPADTALASTPSSSAEDSPEERIREKLRGSETDQKDKYAKYLAKPGNGRDNVFSCLRGWSSATTLLEGGADCHWSGGGYFLKWQGKGVVIDPGFDFLDNFHDAHYNGREIDAVMVSHNHPDHNYDLRSVDDLRYELYRRWKELKSMATTDPASAAMLKECGDRDLSKCFIVLDDDTKGLFSEAKVPHRGTAASFTRSDYEERRWRPKMNSLPVSLEHFPVIHTPDVPHAVGMRLRLHRDGADDLVLGYTGDTEYNDGLPAHLMGCDILLAHISMPDYQEYTDAAHQKKGHLGYNGLAKLIAATKPKLVLVGEFWAGLADLRIELVQGLRRRTALNAILPTGLGFHLNLPDLTVECTNCRKPVAHSDVKITPATEAFGPLGYLCSRCIA